MVVLYSTERLQVHTYKQVLKQDLIREILSLSSGLLSSRLLSENLQLKAHKIILLPGILYTRGILSLALYE